MEDINYDILEGRQMLADEIIALVDAKRTLAKDDTWMLGDIVRLCYRERSEEVDNDL